MTTPSSQPPSADDPTAGSSSLDGHRFPVIAIGASAGGLRALERFLAPVPADAVQAFVVIQHLDPTHRPMLVELLQRQCALPVAEASDGTVLRPAHVYVIPPDRELSVRDGVLEVREPVVPRGHRLPIDVFFTALADDRGQDAVGVVLSGMGMDGSAGLRSIREQGGGTYAQSPDSSEFDSMPRHAISAGVVDVVASPEALYGEILKRPAPLSDSSWDGIDKVIQLVRSRTGHDFSLYKRSTLTRRIARRMQMLHTSSLEQYLQLLRSDPAEASTLFDTLLIGVTRFFRDADAWDELVRTAIPAILAAHAGGGTIRAWVPGCSTGEEAFSLAIVFHEALAELGADADITVQIFATDLDRHAVAVARTALYPPSIAGDVSAERLRRFFVLENEGYRLVKPVRESVILAPQNVVTDPPFTRLDLISCRNLLIYLTPALQQKLLPLFHYSLLPHGMLFLGSAETAGPVSAFFTPVVESARIYRRSDKAVVLQDLNFPKEMIHSPSGELGARGPDDSERLRSLLEEMVLQRFAPTALLVRPDGRVLQTLGDHVRFFGPDAPEPSELHLGVASTPLTTAIMTGVATALHEDHSIVVDDLAVGEAEQRMQVRIAIAPVRADRLPEGACLVVLEEVSPHSSGTSLPGPDASGRMARELDSMVRKLERAQQETLASQQTLRATNEELQSANEELISSKEEMQSMNEELQTVNHELQAKLDELTLASNDMTNLLNSTSIATLFLDAELNVRRFTTPTTKIIRLIPGDVGRPITDLVSALEFPDMVDVARSVLRTLVVFERTVPASGGRWFNVRIMPYRTQDDHIDGLVLTFTDATQAKTLEAALREAQRSLEARLATQADGGSQSPLPVDDSGGP